MTIKVAINGYGRIGRNVLRAFYEGGKKQDIQIVAINDLGNAESNAHLTRYDTAHGKFPGTVTVEGDNMIVNGDKIRVFAQRNPAEIPWGELGAGQRRQLLGRRLLAAPALRGIGHKHGIGLRAAGITFGSETAGGFRNVEAYNITVERAVPVGILFKSAHTRGGFGENLRLHDFTMKDVAVVLRITMNWNPSYSYAAIPPGMKDVPPYWKVLATPVPREKGIAHFHDVEIRNIKATGAATAFEVSGYKEAPLQRFTLDKLDIHAATGGHLYDIDGWRITNSRLELGAPLEMEDARGAQGLPQGSFIVRPAAPRADPSKKSFEEQDKT